MRVRHLVIQLFALLAGCGICGSASAACTGTPTFQDMFQTLDPSWGNLGAAVSVQNGTFYITPPPGQFQFALSQSNFYGDGSICVTGAVNEASDLKGADVDVLFWAADYSNVYVLQLGVTDGKGYFQVSRLANGRWLTPVAWTANPAIKPNLGDANAIEVQMKGGTAAIFINGAKMTQFNGSPPNGGGLIGLAGDASAGTTVKVAFQKFQFFAATGP